MAESPCIPVKPSAERV